MSTVVFVIPFAFESTVLFAEAVAARPGVRLALVSQDPLERFPETLRTKLAAHWRVENALDPNRIAGAVKRLERRLGKVDRLHGTLEQVQLQLGLVREALGIEGMGFEASRRFRDKVRMKQILRAADLPIARHRVLASADDARELAAEVGFPLVLKPTAGVGSRSVHAATDAASLERILAEFPPHPQRPVLGEEFVEGEEHSFDAVTVGGKTLWSSITHYLPSPLDVLANPWIQWCVLLPREVDDPVYDDVRELGARALEALGMWTGVSHLEWFRRRNGSIVLSEAAARPGGARISKLISRACGIDFHAVWAEVMVEGTFTPPERGWAAGCAFLRGQGRGRVRAVHGLEQAQEEIGPLVVETRLPRVGQVPSSSYEGDGYVLLRHRDTGVVRDALERLISTVRVELG